MQRTSHPVHQEVEAEEDEVVLEEAFQTEGVALPVAHPSEDLLLGVVLQAGQEMVPHPLVVETCLLQGTCHLPGICHLPVEVHLGDPL